MIVFVDLGPENRTFAWETWMPMGLEFSRRRLRDWGDIRTNRQRVADLKLQHGDTAILLGDRVREAVGGLPRLLMHPIVRGGVTYRQLPATNQTEFYTDPTIRAILEELFRCLTEPASTATRSSPSPSSSP